VDVSPSKIHLDVTRGNDSVCRATVRSLNLSDHGRHKQDEWRAADVILEARRLSTGSYHRESLGALADVEKSLPLTFALSGFDDEADITFRIKIVDSSKRLLGDGDRIRTGEPEKNNREPLIPLVQADLKEEVWKVDWVDLAGPRVLINRRLPNWRSLLTHDRFVQGLIIPQIVRSIVSELPSCQQRSDDWLLNWAHFLESLGFDDIPNEEEDEEEEIREWVEKVIAAFCEKFKFATKAEEHLHSGEDA
jgi:hypothetical protein